MKACAWFSTVAQAEDVSGEWGPLIVLMLDERDGF